MGTDAQKREFLPRFATGELRGGLALTEPDCGTDLQAIRTIARREGDHYVVNGTKTWISNGIHGSCFALLVKTDPAAEPRHRGMSMFLAEKGPGFRVGAQLEKLGYKGIDSAELVFEDYRVPADRLIGGVEGRGLASAIAGLELGRVNVAARGVGVAQRALDESVRYAQQRRTFGKPIHEHQAIALKLGDMATRVEAARLLTEKAADALRPRRALATTRPAWPSSSPRRPRSRTAWRRMRIHGGYGYTKEFVVERLYRDAPLLVIGEGTNELQRLLIAKRLIERNRLLTAMLPLARRHGARGRAVRRRAFRHHAAGRSGRRGDQGGEPGGGRRCRPLGRAVSSSARATATSTRPSTATSAASRLNLKHPEGMRVFHRLVGARPTRCCDNLRGDLPGEARPHLRGAEGSTIRASSARTSRPMAARGSRAVLAGLRLPDAGRGRLPVRHRRAGRAAVALRAFHRRHDDRADGGLRARLGRGRRARERARHGPRRQPVRHGAAQPLLSRHLVPQRRPCAGPRAALARIRPFRPRSSTARRTAGSSSCATRRSSGRSWPSASAGPIGRPTRASPASRTAWRTATR